MRTRSFRNQINISSAWAEIGTTTTPLATPAESCEERFFNPETRRREQPLLQLGTNPARDVADFVGSGHVAGRQDLVFKY